MKGLKVPQNLSLTNAINFCNGLWALESHDEYEFNFVNLGHVEPFTMAYVANEIRRFRNSKPDCKFTAKNHEGKTYAAHMGFFQAFGLKFGNEPGQAFGSSTYLPLTNLDISEFEKEAADSYSHVGNIIEARSHEMSKLLTRRDGGNLVDTLTFSIREIIRNVIEHSGSPIVQYCAQYWPTKDLIEVAILDTGRGVMAGLSTNPFLTMKTERDALHLALLPGVSGKMYKGVKKRPNDEWQNSGFGLYMTSRICRNGGSFLIVSNDRGLLLDGDTKKDIDSTYQGVALRMRINTNKIGDYAKMLDRYRNEGYSAAKKFSGGDAVEPSVASTMLARDFRTI